MSQKLKFYTASFCPFAQRTWLAILEKGIEHETVYVNYFNKSLPTTKELYEVNPEKTVPAGYPLSNPEQKLYDSLPFNEYLEDNFDGPALWPRSAFEKYKGRMFIQKHSGLISSFYQFLMSSQKDGNVKSEKEIKFHQSITNFAESFLSEKDPSGPYYFGNQFSLVDIAFVPFIERAEVLLSHYNKYNLWNNENVLKLKPWYDACSQRDSFKITAAKLSGDALVLPFESTEREPLLIEMYEMYAWDEVARGKEILADAPAGKRTYFPPTESS